MLSRPGEVQVGQTSEKPLPSSDAITDTELSGKHCLEAVDRVGRDPETTAFKRRARLQQALWRESQGLPIGTEPTRPNPGQPSRPLGSRIEVEHAHATGANFVTAGALEAVRKRLANPERYQMLSADRLYADLLSSMPMCFNFFGPLSHDPSAATAAVSSWWPDAPGRVDAVRFEWSPGRRIPGRFVENASAFDVAFELRLSGDQLGVIGIETKYHEHCKRESRPSDDRMRRYEHVTLASGIFDENALDALVGTHLQQIWLDHLLALSMLQDSVGRWTWAKFVLVHPERNPSFARAAAEYGDLLLDSSSFEVRTLESLLDAHVLPPDAAAAVRERYTW